MTPRIELTNSLKLKSILAQFTGLIKDPKVKFYFQRCATVRGTNLTAWVKMAGALLLPVLLFVVPRANALVRENGVVG